MSGSFFSSANVAAQNQLVTWINEAGLLEGNRKADLLRKIIEILIHQIPQMIPTYCENILSYSSDKTTEVKKQVIIFIESISKEHPEYLPKVIGQMPLLLSDSVAAVQKRVIQASSIVYRASLNILCNEENSASQMKLLWEQVSRLKLQVLNMVDSDNEGIRTHTIKFLEEVVLLQCSPEVAAADEFSLDRLPRHLNFVRKEALEEEAEHIFTLLLKFHNSQHISSVNLMTCMTTLCLIAKLRPKFMHRVLRALGDLHTTLPPTLSQSQVNSVRKHLKMQLIILAKHPSSNDMMPQLTQLLIDIGMTNQEINKAIPKERRNKRVGEIKVGDVPSKRFRMDSPQSNSQGSDSNSRGDFSFDDNEAAKPAVSEESIFDGLNSVDNVVALVMSTLANHLPNEMPYSFTTLYKPIPNAGSKAQKRSLAKMIQALVKGEPIQTQPKLSDIASKIPLLKEDEEKVSLKNAVAKLQESTKAERQIESAVSKLMEETRQEHLKEEERKNKDKEKVPPPQTPTVPKLKQKVKMLRLQEITRPIPKEIKEKLIIQSVARILQAEKDAVIGGAENIRAKLISLFASSYTPDLRDLVLSHILEDPGNRIDIAISWLYEEYALMQGFNRHPVTLQPKVHEKHDQNYNQLLCALITRICEQGDPATESTKDVLIRKIYLEAPLVTEEAVDYLKHLVTEDKIMFLALELLEEICLTRPPRAHKYVVALLGHILNELEDIRETAIKSTIKIYKCGSEATKRMIEKHAKVHLGFISLSSPPLDLFVSEHSRIKHKWTDELYKLCLNLAMALFPENEDLIIEIARVYGQASADAKRCVLRAVEAPVRAAQAQSAEPRPAFMRLLDECPRGAETLLTRLVHIVTEKSPPTPELVSKVRDLYATRVSDVRFLIPVINGLSRKEILAALPKLIKLNPVVVKEVFNKLLGLQNPDEDNVPVSPAELLVALHLIDPSKADLKYIIKATALCFAEKQTYTQEVLAVVLERLLEEPEIPVLMMRTVLQALTLYPSLSGLVLNILQRLIDKEVWDNKVAWEGWIKCCERTAPESWSVVARLPAAPLGACLSSAAALRASLRNLPPESRSRLPEHVLLQLSQPEPKYVEPQYVPPDQHYMPPETQYAPPPGSEYVAPPVEYVPPPAEYVSEPQYGMNPEPPYTPPIMRAEPLPPGME